ncbi:MAG TPA: 2OG-Fe dioxygenase family protein [Arenibaculum sp.]|nr:2OG-Fe dioxygenase family protein [Arenibaculum sp.]
MATRLLRIVDTGIDTASIRDGLDETPHDKHFGQGWRHRSMSRFALLPDGGFVKQEAKPLYQSNSINPIENYGGIYRDYAELPDALVSSPAFARLVQVWRETVPVPFDRFSAHHIRTRAPGAPVPEGRHRDGYEFVGMCVLQRRSIDGSSGVTQFWDRGSDEEVLRQMIEEGQFAIFDDRDYLHYTSDVRPSDASGGVRDVLIFTIPEHGDINPQTEVQ